MRLYRLFKCATYEQIKQIFLIFLIFILIFLGISLFLFFKDYFLSKTWIIGEGIVTDYNISDSKNVWTNIEYEYDGKIYEFKTNGHSGYMLKGYKLKIYINPKKNDDIKISNNLYVIPKIFLIITSSLIFPLLLLLPIFVKKRRDYVLNR